MAEDTVKDRVYTAWSEVRTGTGLYGNTSSPQESNTDLFSEQPEDAIRSREEDAAVGISAEKELRKVVPNHDEEILAPAAKPYGLDLKETHLALMAAAAGKEVAQRAATATDDELRHLRDTRRLWDLRLDLHQKLDATADLPDPLQTRAQYRAAGSLVRTQTELRQLEEKLFGHDQVSEKEPGAREAKRLMNGFERPQSSLAA